MLALSCLMLMFGDTLKTSSNFSSASAWLRLCLLMHSDVTFDYKFRPSCHELAVSGEFCDAATKAATFLSLENLSLRIFVFKSMACIRLRERLVTFPERRVMLVEGEFSATLNSVCTVMLLVNSGSTGSCSSYEWERN